MTEPKLISSVKLNKKTISGTSDDTKRLINDPMRVHQSSIMAQGWGTGNCFYLGVEADGTDTARGKHRFQCQNVGALAKSANLQLAFQFTISQVGKGMDLGGTTATHGVVTGVATSVICELKISTHKTAATATTAAVSSELWYQAKVTVPVDPSNSLKYQSFLGME